jgi:two-component system, chemotaxis family, protein-glutamate methylesterase/glutaminase
MTSPVRVLVVDDSALMRKLIPQILQIDDSIEVVGTAMDGTFGLKKIEDLRPQVITLDLEMPGLSGLDTLKAIKARHGIPVIVVSSHSTEGAAQTLRALSLGAFDFVAKPKDVAEHMPEIANELIAKIKAAAHAPAIRPLPEPPRASPKLFSEAKIHPTRIIALGISTGGPQALQYLLPQLPPDFPAAILIAQHMPEGFTDKFARRLDEVSSIRVKEAQSGDLLRAGWALVCPGNRHLKLKRLFTEEIAVLSDEAPVNGHRPSVDILFHSVAEECGTRSIAALMTGMGEDGARGLGAVQAAGGLTIAQSEKSCVVYGMPKVAIERGYASRILSLEELAPALIAESAFDYKKEAARRLANTSLAAAARKS